MTVIGLAGTVGCNLPPFADILVAVPSRSRPLIQQDDFCIYPYLCAKVKERIQVEPLR